MSKRRRKEVKNITPQQPSMPESVSSIRKLAQPYAKARILFDHPHAYRDWNIIGYDEVPGFFLLESRIRLNSGEMPSAWTILELCLHESQFERL
jgi:hypothetical protein